MDCAFTPEKPRERLRAIPLIQRHSFRALPVMDGIPAADVTNVRAARFEEPGSVFGLNGDQAPISPRFATR